MTDSVHGKTELSLRRKKSNVPASQSPTISSDIKFAHQLNAGETTIPLDALVQPVQMPAFVNPSAEKIAQANVKANASNLILVSSIKGTLMCDLSYKVISNTQINLEFAAEANEIITGQFRSTRGTDDLLEGRLWSVSGTLSAGNTDFALGQSFNTNANPNYQIGEVVVFIDGVQQFRNVDNAAAAPAADGNYEEVDAGGVFNLIRFNQAFLSDVAVVVMPANYIVTTSDLALQPQLDALAGQIDQMIPTLAAVAGVPETEFQGQPNNVDLKSFGDKVQQNTTDIAQNTADIATKQDAFQNDFQRKILTSSITGNVADVADLRFNNLEVGKKYRLTGQVNAVPGGVGDAGLKFETSGGTVIGVSGSFNNGGSTVGNGYFGVNIVFEAIDTVLISRAIVQSGGVRIGGYNNADGTFLILEELPNHVETSKWT
jgi:hypothetical protein